MPVLINLSDDLTTYQEVVRTQAKIKTKKFFDIISEQMMEPISWKDKPSNTVIQYANIISSMDLTVKTSSGQEYPLNFLRGMVQNPKEAVKIFLPQVEQAVKLVIPKISEASLKSALTHLLTGNQVFKKYEDFQFAMALSSFDHTIWSQMSYLMGMAIQNRKKSLQDFLDTIQVSLPDFNEVGEGATLLELRTEKDVYLLEVI